MVERSGSEISYLEQNLSQWFQAASLAWLELEVFLSFTSYRVISKISIVLIELVIPGSKWRFVD